MRRKAQTLSSYTIRYAERAYGKLTARNQYGIRVMDRIAKETGGAAIDAGSMDPRRYFHQIAEELRISYELAYYPTNDKKDESFRKIYNPRETRRAESAVKNGIFSR